jgi:hypothetical protein
MKGSINIEGSRGREGKGLLDGKDVEKTGEW